MKKYLLLFLLLIPAVSFAASSVRVLGTKSATPASSSSTGVKVTPAKVSAASTGNATTSRTGILRAKPKTDIVSNTASSGTSSARFPVVVSTLGSYNNANVPKTTGMSFTTGVDTEAIINAVMENVAKDYYNKDQVYDNDMFRVAVRDVDDPRIDAIRTRDPSSLHPGVDLPADYVYMWIER